MSVEQEEQQQGQHEGIVDRFVRDLIAIASCAWSFSSHIAYEGDHMGRIGTVWENRRKLRNSQTSLYPHCRQSMLYKQQV
eukprot:scaffold659_cov192-Ochromonas_danica.AAC.11